MKRHDYFFRTLLSLGLCAGILGSGFSPESAQALEITMESQYSETMTGATLESSELVLQVGQTNRVKINIEPVGAVISQQSYSVFPSDVAEVELVEENGERYVSVTGLKTGSTLVSLSLDNVLLDLNVTVLGTPVQKHTKKEIRSFIKKNGVSVKTSISYKKKAKVKAPYAAGELSAKTKKSALKMLNNIRYIAGLDANVQLDSVYGKLAQAASLVNAVNQQLSHFPARPKKMKNSLYQLGYEGAGSSNIAMGFQNLNQTLISGWMADSDSANIDRVGHRRWILNPTMKKTGFGAVKSFMAMYSFDREGSGTQTNVFWPAQTMPIDYFDNTTAWSVSTGQSLSKKKIKVRLVRLSDNRTWTFSSTTKKNAKKSGYFNVENSIYGLTGCIIFRPNKIKYTAKDKFQVTITGIPTGDLQYEVNFFRL